MTLPHCPILAYGEQVDIRFVCGPNEPAHCRVHSYDAVGIRVTELYGDEQHDIILWRDIKSIAPRK